MKPRHAVALALVGWYLIAPPVREPGRKEPDYLDEHAAYRDWKLVYVLNSQDECERLREWIKERMAAQGDAADLEEEQFVEAECFASDDPRIKGIDQHALIPPRPR
jgi:hypothetical protein